MKRYAFITLGAFLAALGYAGFSARAGLVTGGAAGISVILKKLFNLPLGLTTLVINVPIFVAAYKSLGMRFLTASVYASLLFSLFLGVLEGLPWPEMTEDLLLASVAGGVITGVGLGLALKNFSSTGGTDMLAVTVHKRHPEIKTADVINIADGIIIAAGTFIFGLEKSFYAVLSVLVTTRVITRITEGGRGAKGVLVMSERSHEIAAKINRDLKRGATLFDVHGAYSEKKGTAVFVAVPEREILLVREIIDDEDPLAFTVLADIRQVFGDFEKAPHRHR